MTSHNNWLICNMTVKNIFLTLCWGLFETTRYKQMASSWYNMKHMMHPSQISDLYASFYASVQIHWIHLKRSLSKLKFFHAECHLKSRFSRQKTNYKQYYLAYLSLSGGVVMLVDSASMYCNLIDITVAHPHCSYHSTLATKQYTLLSYTLQPVQPGKRTKQSLVLIWLSFVQPWGAVISNV